MSTTSSHESARYEHPGGYARRSGLSRRLTHCLAGAVLAAGISMVVGCGGGNEQSSLTAAQPSESDSTGFEGARERTNEVLYVLARDGEGFQLGILGVALDDVRALQYDGVDLLPAMSAMVQKGRAEFLQLEDSGFYFITTEPPSSLGLNDEGSFSVWTSAGWSPPTTVALGMPPFSTDATDRKTALAAKSSCPWLTFRAPTAVAKNKSCGFASTSCAVAGMAHSGTDYSGSGNVVAAADGVVVWKETMSSRDHGMGTNLVLRHRLSSCTYVYTSYSHLGSIEKNIKVGSAVSIGQKLGTIGGSGYGRADYWGRHLHFEVKSAPTTGNPLGVGTKKSTCHIDAKNAAPQTCWGYLNAKLGPKAYGYHDPGDYLSK